MSKAKKGKTDQPDQIIRCDRCGGELFVEKGCGKERQVMRYKRIGPITTLTEVISGDDVVLEDTERKCAQCGQELI